MYIVGKRYNNYRLIYSTNNIQFIREQYFTLVTQLEFLAVLLSSK